MLILTNGLVDDKSVTESGALAVLKDIRYVLGVGLPPTVVFLELCITWLVGLVNCKMQTKRKLPDATEVNLFLCKMAGEAHNITRVTKKLEGIEDAMPVIPGDTLQPTFVPKKKRATNSGIVQHGLQYGGHASQLYNQRYMQGSQQQEGSQQQGWQGVQLQGGQSLQQQGWQNGGGTRTRRGRPRGTTSSKVGNW